MNPRIQHKIDEIKKLSDQSKNLRRNTPFKTVSSTNDALSISIRSKRDADTFMAELKAIGKK